MIPIGGSPVGKALKIILIATLCVFILQLISARSRMLEGFGALVPVLVFTGGEIWRLVTYMFLHDTNSVFHFFFNMLVLWMFGMEIEERWGYKRFLIFYLLAGVFSGLVSAPMWYSPIVGASGAVFAVMTIYAFYYPDRQVLLFFIIPTTVKWMVIFLAGISLLFSFQRNSAVAHLTHLGGVIFAVLYHYGYDRVMNMVAERRSRRREMTVRKKAVDRVRSEKSFEEVIDPILKKISEQGMDSLTPQEKEILQNPGKYKGRILRGNFGQNDKKS